MARKETLQDFIEAHPRPAEISTNHARRQFHFAVCIVAALTGAMVTTAIAGVSAYEGQTAYWTHAAPKHAALAKP